MDLRAFFLTICVVRTPRPLTWDRDAPGHHRHAVVTRPCNTFEAEALDEFLKIYFGPE